MSPVQKFSINDALLERSPGEDADIFVGNVVDQRHGAPISIGYSRYGPLQQLTDMIAVHDVMIVLDGRLSVMTDEGTLVAGPGELVHMPPGERVTIHAHENGATTAFVTYPHWRDATGG